jgi:phospholipid/cholesterol/gamma-HCH transport system substrate-binding protein
MVDMKKFEMTVGFFLLLAIASLLFLAFRVSSLSFQSPMKSYEVIAIFDNVGDLKTRAPISMSGVRIGEVTGIHIDPKTFKAVVRLRINEKQNNIPVDTTASIYTQGLLGSNYISLMPGFDDQHFLRQGSTITNTHSAIILENLIGQFLFSIKNSDNKDKS